MVNPIDLINVETVGTLFEELVGQLYICADACVPRACMHRNGSCSSRQGRHEPAGKFL